jgi:hypothetical protein
MSSIAIPRPRMRSAPPFDPATLDPGGAPPSLAVDAARKSIEEWVLRILATLERPLGAFRGSRRGGHRPRAAEQVREYLESEVLGTSPAELAGRRGVSANAVTKSIERGRRLVESTRGRLVEGGFSSPDRRDARPREGRNERQW